MSAVAYPRTPLAVVTSLWDHRHLIWQLTRRDVVGRYRGSAMGLMWSFLTPLLMLTVYTFVFSVVFKARWGEGETTKFEFAVIAFVGMIVHGLFAECINRAPGLVLSNVNYVKKVVFPLEVLPWVAMGSAFFHTVVSSVVLLIAFGLMHFHVHWTAIFLPVVLLPLMVLTMGLAWFLASFGVYVRDVGQVTGIVTTAMLFLAPVFFPRSALPAEYQPLLNANPLTFIIEQAREALIWGRLPDWAGLALYLASSLLIAWLGLVWFQKTRRGFADVV